MKSDKTVKNTAFSIILLSLSLILGYIEALFPINFGQAGIKIGLSNIITLIGLKLITTRRIFILSLLRVIILGILFGNLVRFILSIAGFLLSFIVMYLLLNKFSFSIIVTSIFGGVSHNIGQILALILIVKNNEVIVLIPIYVLIGIITGLFIGVISDIIYRKLNLIKIFKL